MSSTVSRVPTGLARLGLPLVAACLLAAACSSGAGHAPAAGTGSAGGSSSALTLTDGHLTDASGRTVYLWVADTGDESTCTGACASVWPPVPARGTPTAGSGVSAAQLTVIARADSSRQLSYAGHPLYYFGGDTAAGQAHGQGSDSFGARWWEVSATGTAVTTTGTAPTPATSSSSSGYGY